MARRSRGVVAPKGLVGGTEHQSPGDAMIICEDVHMWYGNFHVLRGVSTIVQRGEKVVICGPSGSGKSSFIRTLNRLETHQRGRIVIDGTELTPDVRNIAAVRRETGMVFQQFNLFPHLSVLRNITLGPIHVRGMAKDEAEALALGLLERVGLKDHAHKLPAQLSGGQQQRVAIARALAMQPKIMLFDEPTSALDPEMINEVLDGMREQARAGMTMLIGTLEMGFAREVADRILFFDEGRIVESAPPAEFFTNPKEERTRQFLSQILRQ